MTRLRLFTLFLLLLVTPASSQVFSWCPKCYMVSYVDIPAAGPASAVSSAGFWIAGWGFVCEGGAPADRVDLWYQKDDGWWDPLLQPDGSLWTNLYRPDVQQVYAASCPGVGSNTGWHLWVSNTPPRGARNIIVNVWQGPFLEGHTRQVIVE